MSKGSVCVFNHLIPMVLEDEDITRYLNKNLNLSLAKKGELLWLSLPPNRQGELLTFSCLQRCGVPGRVGFQELGVEVGLALVPEVWLIA